VARKKRRGELSPTARRTAARGKTFRSRSISLRMAGACQRGGRRKEEKNLFRKGLNEAEKKGRGEHARRARGEKTEGRTMEGLSGGREQARITHVGANEIRRCPGQNFERRPQKRRRGDGATLIPQYGEAVGKCFSRNLA